jgi:hypothetical protein
MYRSATSDIFYLCRLLGHNVDGSLQMEDLLGTQWSAFPNAVDPYWLQEGDKVELPKMMGSKKSFDLYYVEGFIEERFVDKMSREHITHFFTFDNGKKFEINMQSTEILKLREEW